MSTRRVPTSTGAFIPPYTSPLMQMRSGVCADSFLPEVSETVSWLASSSEHFVNKPAASSSPVVARICGGAILEIIIFLCPHPSVPAFQLFHHQPCVLHGNRIISNQSPRSCSSSAHQHHRDELSRPHYFCLTCAKTSSTSFRKGLTSSY